jgi:acetyl esterase/lipase
MRTTTILIAALLATACVDPPREAPTCLVELPSCFATDGGPCFNVPEAARSVVAGRDLHTLLGAGYARTAPPTDPAAWQARSAELRDFLWQASRLPRERSAPAATQVGPRRLHENVIVEDLLIDGFEGMQLPAALYLPSGATGPVPAVVVYVGHDTNGQNTEAVRIMCWRFAKHGIAALSIDWLGMGTRYRYDQMHVPMGARSLMVGLLPSQPMFEEPLRAWDYLAARPEVDPTRVGMVGQSGGGLLTMYLAAMEPRVAAAVVVDISVSNAYIFDTLRGWGDLDSFFPGVHARTSHGEILGMLAPRPLLVLSGQRDVIAPTEVVEAELAITRGAYALAGAAGAVRSQGFDTEHCWCGGKIEAAVAFLGEALTGTPITERLLPPFQTGGLASPSEGSPRWPDLLPPRLARPPEPPPFERLEAELWQSELQGDLLAVTAAQPRPRGTFAAGGTPSRGCGVTVLWISDTDAPAPRSLDRPGLWIVHLRPVGMELVERGPIGRRLRAQLALMLGRTILGLMVEDILWAADGVRDLGAYKVVAVCDGEQASIACLAASARVRSFDAVVVRGLPHDFGALLPVDPVDPLANQPWGVMVTPGLAAVASPDMLLAQVAPRPLAVLGATADDFPFAEAIYDAEAAHDVLAFPDGTLDAAALWAVDRLGVLE